jgi:hypothetical protein
MDGEKKLVLCVVALEVSQDSTFDYWLIPQYLLFIIALC